MTAKMEKTPSSSASKRPLRRSRTINCNVASRPVQENGEDKVEEEVRSPESPELPQSSCQALRHAVSALTRLDDFICEKIGAGFFSEVFKVTHRITGQVLALKMNTMTSNRHNMLREVQLLNRLQHPNILRFMGVCVHEGQLHALTECIPNGNLEQLLEKKEEELPWTQRIQITLGLARGLDYLHSEGFIHRDLTSKNILIRQEDGYHAVIADFGLAIKIPDPLSEEKLPTVGSPYWMAPEVLNGHFYNERADLFSVGIIMCEITARIPADPDVMPRMKNFGVDYVALSEMISYCPLDYLQLAFKCCQVDPQKRPRGVEIIEWLEKIFKNLKNDIFTRQQKEKKTERNGHKRSRSEDNILQANDSETDTSSEDIVITPLLIGQVMSRDDPSYAPSSNNPFAAIQRFQHGRKLLGTSIDFAAELPSPADLFTSPSTPGHRGRDEGMVEERRCQSLPSSPELLRRAAEKHHQESLHGSAQYYHQHSQALPSARSRSKSTAFSDTLAQRLQTQLLLSQPPKAKNLASTQIPESEMESGEGGLEQSEHGVVTTIPPPAPSRKANGCTVGHATLPFSQSTATRRRMTRRLKYQSLDGDVVGVPPIHPLPPIHAVTAARRSASPRSQPLKTRDPARPSIHSAGKTVTQSTGQTVTQSTGKTLVSSGKTPVSQSDGKASVSTGKAPGAQSAGKTGGPLGKASISQSAGKVSVSQSTGKASISQSAGKVSVSQSAGKVSVSQSPGKPAVSASSSTHKAGLQAKASNGVTNGNKPDTSVGPGASHKTQHSASVSHSVSESSDMSSASGDVGSSTSSSDKLTPQKSKNVSSHGSHRGTSPNIKSKKPPTKPDISHSVTSSEVKNKKPPKSESSHRLPSPDVKNKRPPKPDSKDGTKSSSSCQLSVGSSRRRGSSPASTSPHSRASLADKKSRSSACATNNNVKAEGEGEDGQREKTSNRHIACQSCVSASSQETSQETSQERSPSSVSSSASDREN